MIDVYQNRIGNADSRTHDFGNQARIVVENARNQVASLLNVAPSEIFFTSGATESNNIAIQGLQAYAAESGKNHIITTAIEHKAVLETVKAMESKGFEIDIVFPDRSGRISEKHILQKVKETTLLVSVMHVNNETGIIQPVTEIGEALAQRGVLFHVDATQSCGKLVDELQHLKYNMLAFSAHKLQGPQGVGVLVLRKHKYKLPPVQGIMYGGQQEKQIRPGTVPVALVAGCGKSCELAELNYTQNAKKIHDIKAWIISTLSASGLIYHINGDQNFCLDNTINICFPGVSSEALMIATKQFCSISNGSACTSKSYSPSYVLTAMGLPQSEIDSSIRISWGPNTSLEELKEEFPQMLQVVRSLAM